MTGKFVSRDGKYVGEYIVLEAVPKFTHEHSRNGPSPRHGDGEYVVVTNRHGYLVDYCGTVAEFRQYFPDLAIAEEGS